MLVLYGVVDLNVFSAFLDCAEGAWYNGALLLGEIGADSGIDFVELHFRRLPTCHEST